MEQSPVPKDYKEWRYCIEKKCGIPLELAFIKERITALQDSSDHKTKKFLKQYGEEYRERVIEWFKHALKETK